MRKTTVLFLLFCLLGLTNELFSHEIRPASLIIEELESSGDAISTFKVTWKIPTRDDRVVDITPIFDSEFELITKKSEFLNSDFLVTTFQLIANKRLSNTTLSIQNLENTLIDVIVTVLYKNGDEGTALIQPTSNKIDLPKKNTVWSIIETYTKLGVEHILIGYDHLLFVLALLILSSSFSKLIKTITAFTVAHSITLSLTIFGFINLPSDPVEATIALSIVFLAYEILNYVKGKETLTTKNPWLIAFIFGLLHGLGFAGALAEIGLPKINISYALAFFNIGVEIGQIIFILAVSVLIFLIFKIFPRPKNLTKIAGYAIGSIAMFWLIERVVGIIII